jgi:NADPH:quinone reductase-like Zn-dependent oxidoreductase
MAEPQVRPREPQTGATGDDTTTMHAVVYSEYGGPEVLRYTRVDRPVPADDEVLIQVISASIGAGDWHLMRGTPFLIRLIYRGYWKPKQTILGVDIAGRVVEVGRAVTSVQSGDEVVCDLSESGFGGFAEYVCVSEQHVVPKPAGVSFEAAATVPTSGAAALQALRDAGGLRAGESVLINGASGGVGTFAVQVAKYLGADVTAVCSTAKVELVRSIGADHVVDYTQEDVTSGDRQFDLIVDTAGSHSLREWGRVLSRSGRYVMVGGPTRRFVTAMTLGPVLSARGGRRYGGFTLKPNPNDLQLLMTLLDAGDVTPVIDRRYPLQQVPEAIRYLEAGRATGKVVVRSA